MTTFYCVRHGKTEYNKQHVFQGGLADSPLLPEGQQTAALAGAFLQSISFDKVFVSPQKRAQDTAKLLLKAHGSPTPIETIDDLREMEFGDWDGHPESDYYDYPEFQNLVHAPHLYDPSAFGGETFKALITRTLSVFDALATTYPDDTILIVSHGLTLQTILKTLNGSSVAEIRSGKLLDNTSITTLVSTLNDSSEPCYSITDWNNTNHIK